MLAALYLSGTPNSAARNICAVTLRAVVLGRSSGFTAESWSVFGISRCSGNEIKEPRKANKLAKLVGSRACLVSLEKRREGSDKFRDLGQ